MKDTQLIDLSEAMHCQLNLLLTKLKTSIDSGLTPQLVEARRAQFGPNLLPEKPTKPMWLVFLGQIFNWFSLLLWVAAGLSLTLFFVDGHQRANLYLAIVIICIIFLVGCITLFQAEKSNSLMTALKQLMPHFVTCVRGSAVTQIPGSELVPGDVVLLKHGDRVPADLRVLQSKELKVDHSSLTGQSGLLLRVVQGTQPKDPLHSTNLCFFGTNVGHGRGKGVVVATGASTLFGQIAGESMVDKPMTPLRKELNKFVLILTLASISTGLVVFLLAALVGGARLSECFVLLAGVLVAMVPQGLLGCITISLALTAERLHHKNVLVRNLQSVQTLGSTNCICTDKTGTLTQNRMSVQFIVQDTILTPGELSLPLSAGLNSILRSCAISTQTFVQNGGAVGSASEVALVNFAQKYLDVQGERKKANRLQLFPFSSQHKYSFCIVWEKDHHKVYLKGAPERVYGMCRARPPQKDFQRQVAFLGGKGSRMIGFASKRLDPIQFGKEFKFLLGSVQELNLPMQNFEFEGMFGLYDPPKPGTKEAVETCRGAGIKVIMVTGDHAETARCIAQRVGIITKPTVGDYLKEGKGQEEAFRMGRAVVISGQDLQGWFEAGEEKGKKRLREWLSKEELVFARTTPLQKLQVVRECQALGWTVGVTGDGVNDSPVLRQGDIGIAMGISGSDVSKDVADMILLDDDFSSIVAGIEEGRKIVDILKKTILYILASCVFEVAPFVAFVTMGVPLPLSAMFMIVISIGTDIYPAISLAYEEPEYNTLSRHRHRHFISLSLVVYGFFPNGFIVSCSGFLAYFVTLHAYGFPLQSLLGIVSQTGLLANPSDVFVHDPTQAFGNTAVPAQYRLNCSGFRHTPVRLDWAGGAVGVASDVRLSFIQCNSDTNRWQLSSRGALIVQEDTCRRPTDQFDGRLVCYSTQAAAFAQSAYFAGVVLAQLSNLLSCKSLRSTFTYSEFNRVMAYAMFFEVGVMLMLLYVPGLGKQMGGRPLPLSLLCSPALALSPLLVLFSEARKSLADLFMQVQEKALANLLTL